MASAGWAQLGSTLAGGNKLNSELAYDQGQALGARTQDALAQARSRIDENNARANLDETLSGVPGLEDPKLRAGIVGLIRSKVDPEQTFKAVAQNFQNTQRMKAADSATSPDDAARALYSIENNAQQLRPVGQNQFTDILHPSKGVQATDLGQQLATANIEQKNASAQNARSSAALHADQVAHPEKYHVGLPLPAAAGPPPSDGTYQHEDVAQLIAGGGMPMPAPGSRAYTLLGGDQLVQRVRQLNPNFAGQTYSANQRAQNDLSGGTAAKNVDSVNKVAGHLDVMEQLAGQLNNTSVPVANTVKNWIATNVSGAPAPGNARDAAQILGTEIIRSLTNVGAGSAEERTHLADMFKNSKTPEQLRGAMNVARDMVREQALSLGQRAESHGAKDFISKSFSPNTRKRLQLGEFTPQETPPAAAPAAPSGLPAGWSVKVFP